MLFKINQEKTKTDNLDNTWAQTRACNEVFYAKKFDCGIGVWEKPVYQIVNRKWISTLFGTL